MTPRGDEREEGRAVAHESAGPHTGLGKSVRYADIVEWDGRRWWVSAWLEEHDDGPYRWIFSMGAPRRNRVVAEAALIVVGHAPNGPVS